MHKSKSGTFQNKEYLQTGAVDTLVAATASQNEQAA